ncbi:hypothetical protein Mgra_00000618 [Meloidogyne graminicola]|uniref:DUF148 domain-containing protein n=1 Tax=Meloidogyne graminicola TaxID=189291 RepID=A0A8T0A473_9BILA|nr:hypothetical protein Mgra_00000618 [Meloidogyne graminicola]KAF7640175.1 hypothetical protein Mgra_00000618 [Meloidogyne graminicola]
MQLLTLFLFFIKFVLCSGVTLLEDPAPLPENINDYTVLAIPGLNNDLMEELTPLAVKLNNDMYGPKDNDIIEDLTPPLDEGTYYITAQYEQFRTALNSLKEKFELINVEITEYDAPNTNLQLGINNQENEVNQGILEFLRNLKNKNIEMQNKVILAIQHIIVKVNEHIAHTRQHQNVNINQPQRGRGRRGHMGHGRGV